jgi:hypothetical protein
MTSQQNDGSANNGAIIMEDQQQQPLLLPQPSSQLSPSSSQPMPMPMPMPIAHQPIAPNNMTTPMSMMMSMHQPMIHPYQYQQQLAAQHQQELQQLQPHHQQQQQHQHFAAIIVHSGKLPLSIPNAPAATRGGGGNSHQVVVGPGGTTGPGVTGGGQLLQFPWKLHQMLQLAEHNQKSDIISWLPGGNGFKVNKKDRFCSEVMPGYFASQKYKTFQRSLNLWGFESVAKGPSRGACYHQFFVKGHPELCHNMYV